MATVAAYRAGSRLARLAPRRLNPAAAAAAGLVAAAVSPGKRTLVRRNLERVLGQPMGRVEARRRVAAAFGWYARYYIESFQLAGLGADAIDAGLTYEGYEPVERAARSGLGPILVMPHLGSWEWGAWWLALVPEMKVTAVVEPLDPPEVFEWFMSFRERLGMNVVPLGPDAGRQVMAAVRRGDVVCLLADRDVGGGGVPVDFFGERTRLPAGPALMALRTGAPLLPAAVYWRGRRRHGVVRPPIDTQRRGSIRDDVARVTQDCARALEDLIRAAPEQWHLMSPNWPSDYRAIGRPVPEGLRELATPDAQPLIDAQPLTPGRRRRGSPEGRARRPSLGPVRIGIVCPYSLTVPGGVQTQVLALARALRRKGYDTRVLGPCDGPPPDPGVTALGASIPTISNGSIAPIAPDPSCQLRLIRALRDEDFDVIHLHEPLAPGPTMTALLTKPAPLIGTFHAAGRSLAYDWLPAATRFLAGRLDDRVAVSPAARDMARDALGGDYTLAFNGIELSRYREAAGVPTAEPTIVFLGRHEPRKGLEVLLEALNELPGSVRLWIAGEGPETARLQARSAGDPRIEWLGVVTDTEKVARIAGADVFCAPSLHGESFGVVLLEALAAGTSVVASDLPGYRNVVRPGRDALLVPPGDAEALAGAIRLALDDTDGSAARAAAGHDRADEFSMDRLADLYLDRYQRIARTRN